METFPNPLLLFSKGYSNRVCEWRDVTINFESFYFLNEDLCKMSHSTLKLAFTPRALYSNPIAFVLILPYMPTCPNLFFKE